MDRYEGCKNCCCSDCINNCKECRECNEGLDGPGFCRKYNTEE